MVSKELSSSFEECFQHLQKEGNNFSTSLNSCVAKLLEGHHHESFDDSIHNPSEHYALTHYHLSNYFEVAVELIDSMAGIIVLLAVGLACLNLLIVGTNVVLGIPTFFCYDGHFICSLVRNGISFGGSDSITFQQPVREHASTDTSGFRRTDCSCTRNFSRFRYP
jgi:hypothetical protein